MSAVPLPLPSSPAPAPPESVSRRSTRGFSGLVVTDSNTRRRWALELTSGQWVILFHVTDADEPEEETQEQRAMRSLQAIFGGADLTVEATKLANEFTDRHSGRFMSWVRRWSSGKRS